MGAAFPVIELRAFRQGARTALTSWFEALPRLGSISDVPRPWQSRHISEKGTSALTSFLRERWPVPLLEGDALPFILFLCYTSFVCLFCFNPTSWFAMLNFSSPAFVVLFIMLFSRFLPQRGTIFIMCFFLVVLVSLSIS